MDYEEYEPSDSEREAIEHATPYIYPNGYQRLLNVLSLFGSRKFVVAVLGVLVSFGIDISPDVQAGIVALATLALITTIAWEDVGKAQQKLNSTTFNIGADHGEEWSS